jgi:hypothetical protein
MLNTSLSLGCQQAEILGQITRGFPRMAETLVGNELVIKPNELTVFHSAPVSTELDALEDGWVRHVAGTSPAETAPRVALLGPGMSRTDPLYALRLMAKLTLLTGRASELVVYDFNNDPLIYRYYERLPWGEHGIHLVLGREGNFESLQAADAHLMLAIHPSTPLHLISGVFADNLVRGGIGVIQSTVNEAFSEEDIYHEYLKFCLEPYNGGLDFEGPPIRSRLFRSYFSERSPDVHLVAMRRN